MSFYDILYIVIPNMLLFSVPLIFTALGGVFCERAGVVNIALEGIMTVGACTAIIFNLTFVDTFGSATPWIAILVAMIAGMLFSVLHAVASITLRAEQVVSGVALNMLALAGSMYFVKQIYGAGETGKITEPLATTDIPILEHIPVLGELFFQDTYWTTWIAFGLAVVSWFIIFKTPFGLRLRAVGEHPMAADTMGINVNKMRYVAVIISGAFAAVGGAVYAETITYDFSHSTISGQGFIALASMIFGKWNPLGALGAALFFGLAQSLSIIGSFLPVIQDIPPYFLFILPYVLTILALAGFIGRSEAPAASGVPYIKGKR